MRLKDYSLNHCYVTYDKQPTFLITVLNASVFLRDKKFMSDSTYQKLQELADGATLTVCYSNEFTPNGVRRRIYNVYKNLPSELVDDAFSYDGVTTNQHLAVLSSNIDPYYESDYSKYLNAYVKRVKAVQKRFNAKKEAKKPLEVFNDEILFKLSDYPELQLRVYEYNEAVKTGEDDKKILRNAYESLKAAVDEAIL